MTKEKVNVTVVIPYYNSSMTIERALDSVANQSKVPFEVIIINDGSKDDLVLFKLRYKYPKNWIKLIHLNENKGAATARNVGWDNALGEYLAFLDADDTWHPKKIEIQYTWMKNNCNAVMTGHCMSVANDTLVSNVYIEEINFFLLNRYKLLFHNFFSTPTVMILRSLPYRFPEGKRYSEDYELWLNIAFNSGNCYFLKLSLSTMYKLPYGQAGLSSRLWEMEKGELNSYRYLYENNSIGLLVYLLSFIYSFFKYLRRVLLKATRC